MHMFSTWFNEYTERDVISNAGIAIFLTSQRNTSESRATPERTRAPGRRCTAGQPALGTNYGDKVAEVAADVRNNGLVPKLDVLPFGMTLLCTAMAGPAECSSSFSGTS
jgi:hypothetical protein